MASRVDVVGTLLLAAAAAGAYATYDVRSEEARRYAMAAEYNRTITRFLDDHRERFGDRPVAVYGVAGLSPWSLSAGGYLARLLGGDRPWRVFVPKADSFYPLGAQPGGRIAVHLETQACEVAADPRILHLVIGHEGRGQFADDCRQALALALPRPVIDAWGPQQVTAVDRERGFNMYFTGRHLLPDVEVRVQDRPTPMVYARRGGLMTTAIPGQGGADAAIAFTIVQRDRVVFSGSVAVR